MIALTANEADDLIQDNLGNPDFVILDVRTPAEFVQGAIENAIHIDFMDAQFENQVRQLERGKTYLVYCQSGGRSAMATDAMLPMGFPRLYDMTGGFLAWVNAGLPWIIP
ncbi:MAG: rhodanese-like domain-containing protein [Planctomycetota bacterium]